MRILIADDHAVFRRGLREILSEAFPAAEFGEASNSAEALHLAAEQKWAVLLLDISMPGRGGLDVLKDIRARRPKLPVVVVSMHPEDQYAVRVLKSGGAAYLTKGTAPDDLVAAIKKVLAGGKYVGATLAEKLAVHVESGREGYPHDALSDRELQVMCLIATGQPVSKIAVELSLSPKTVSTYRTRVMDKMSMTTNAELTRYALEMRLID